MRALATRAPAPAPAGPAEFTLVRRVVRVLTFAGCSLFVLGYIAGVAYLAVVVVQERSVASQARGDSVACKQVLCPMETYCVADGASGLPRCSAIGGSQNLQTMELILAIIVGVPAAICIPCSFHWLLLQGCPRMQRCSTKCSERSLGANGDGRSATPRSPELELDLEGGERSSRGALEAGQSQGLVGRLRQSLGLRGSPPDGQRGAEGGETCGGLRAGASAQLKSATAANRAASASSEDDDEMAEFFAPLRREEKQPAAKASAAPVAPAAGGAQGEEDGLDDLFGTWRGGGSSARSKPEAPADDKDSVLDQVFSRAKPKQKAQEEGDDVLDTVFAKAKRRPKGEDRESDAVLDTVFAKAKRKPPPAETQERSGESALDAMFSRSKQRPDKHRGGRAGRRGGAGGAEAGSEAASDSGGLSLLFTRPRSPTERARSAVSGASSGGSCASQSLASATVASSVLRLEALLEEEEAEEEAPDPFDFFGFALRVARRRDGGRTGGADAEAAGAGDAGGESDDSLADLEPASLSELFHAPLEEEGA